MVFNWSLVKILLIPKSDNFKMPSGPFVVSSKF